MNWRRGLFRLWIVGTVLFVIAIAFISYGEIKRQFDAIAAKHLLERHRQHLWHRRQTTSHSLECSACRHRPHVCGLAMASTSKSLAQINKSLDEGRATKKHSALRDASRAERAEFYFDLLCQLAPAAHSAGAFSVPNVARTRIIANSKPPCIFWTTADV